MTPASSCCAPAIYNNGDIGRLNMQRQFYAALFRRLKSIGNIWDVAKLTPAVLNYMETNLSASQLVSFAVSMLKIDSSKIMICQMPIKMAGKYNGQAFVPAPPGGRRPAEPVFPREYRLCGCQ